MKKSTTILLLLLVISTLFPLGAYAEENLFKSPILHAYVEEGYKVHLYIDDQLGLEDTSASMINNYIIDNHKITNVIVQKARWDEDTHSEKASSFKKKITLESQTLFESKTIDVTINNLFNLAKQNLITTPITIEVNNNDDFIINTSNEFASSNIQSDSAESLKKTVEEDQKKSVIQTIYDKDHSHIVIRVNPDGIVPDEILLNPNNYDVKTLNGNKFRIIGVKRLDDTTLLATTTELISEQDLELGSYLITASYQIKSDETLTQTIRMNRFIMVWYFIDETLNFSNTSSANIKTGKFITENMIKLVFSNKIDPISCTSYNNFSISEGKITEIQVGEDEKSIEIYVTDVDHSTIKSIELVTTNLMDYEFKSIESSKTLIYNSTLINNR